MSGQRPYEGRIDKNVRGLFADTNAILLPVAVLLPRRAFAPPPPSLLLQLSFSPRLSGCSNVFFSSTQSFTFNIDELSPVSLFISIYAVLFPSIDNVRSFGRVYRVSDQEIALVSSKSNAPEKIEVALI